jgi:predicted Zn-dependent protease with MMP-like domain
VTRTEFDRIAEAALASLPEEFQPCVANLVLVIKARPSKELLKEMEIADDEDLFGIYDGPDILEQGADDVPELPPRITLFYEPLLDACETEEELTHEIQTTVLHEIGHHFGIDEERLDELGYG